VLNINSAAVDALFAALANPTRRAVLGLLLTGDCTAGEIAAQFDMARPSVSEHVAVLVKRGLVSEHREGRHIRYRLEAEPLLGVSEWLVPFENHWRQHLNTLHRLLDEDLPKGTPRD
jgi:DNA-binding transcriptional ArsR family regulator